MKAFKIPSTATVYKIISENDINSRITRKLKPLITKLLAAAAMVRNLATAAVNFCTVVMRTSN